MADLDPTRTYRAVVIGAGSGGLTLAIGLAGFGHDVVLIEADEVGGDCTNVGCIPSKSLLHAAGDGIDDPLAWARARRDGLRDAEDAEMSEHDRIVLVRGRARLTDRRGPHVVVVSTPEGDETEVRGEHVVVASGSRPVRFPVDGLPADRSVTNEELFELERIPGGVLFVGGGPISLEMATALTDAGARATIVELADRLLPAEDAAIGAEIADALTARGIDVHTGTSIERFDAERDVAHLGDGTEIPGVDVVVLAAGRRPNIEGLDLDAAGVATTPRGVTIDDWGRTSVDGIWAVGDVTGATLTTHGANAIGRRAVRAIALPRVPKLGRARTIPNAVFSRPQVASVGLPLEEVDRRHPAGRLRLSVRLADLDRGLTDDVQHGLVVVDVERFTGRVLRAAIVGPAAAELIGIFTMAVDHDLGLRKMFGMVHPYPAYAEAIGRLADDFARRTFPRLPAEWWAMLRGRLADRRIR